MASARAYCCADARDGEADGACYALRLGAFDTGAAARFFLSVLMHDFLMQSIAVSCKEVHVYMRGACGRDWFEALFFFLLVFIVDV